MSRSKLHEWVHASAERTGIYAQESLIVDVAEEIWAILKAEKMNKAELAAKLGKSKAFVTQVLDGSRNMTLRTLADISAALGRKVCMRLLRQHESDAWESVDAVFVSRAPIVSTVAHEVSNDPSWPPPWQNVIQIREKKAA